jgi:hypothetical protein
VSVVMPDAHHQLAIKIGYGSHKVKANAPAEFPSRQAF